MELLTPDEMAIADRLAIERGPLAGIELMANAGGAVAAEVLARFPAARRYAVLAGPGNNGGDGYVAAGLLARAGANVQLFALAEPKPGSDAFAAKSKCGISAAQFGEYAPEPGDVVIDALFGAGLDRDLAGPVLEAIGRTRQSGAAVVAVDLPSGVSGADGTILGGAFDAALTVTFFRKKPGHLLYPGRALCGQTIVVDIGIGSWVLDQIGVRCFENGPQHWQANLPEPDAGAHKYSRGAVGVFSGGPASTGAARLAAQAAARAGAGAVTVLTPPSAVIVNASHLTSIMLASIGDIANLEHFLADRKTSALVIGPGFGVGERLREYTLRILKPDIAATVTERGVKGIVLDADAISEFSNTPDVLFGATAAATQHVVITPHEGEFARLFPDLAAERARSKLDRAREAAARSGAVVLLKGPDTVIAAPDGRSAINSNGNIHLATAGSGDVLSGLVASLLAQGMPAWEASCAGAWIHAAAGAIAGPGAMAEDIAAAIPAALQKAAGA